VIFYILFLGTDFYEESSRYVNVYYNFIIMNNSKEEQFEVLDQWDYPDSEITEELEDKYAYLIGKFMLHFSALEHELGTEIADLINSRSHAEGYIIIKNLSYNQKIELLSDLCKPRIFWNSKKKRNINRLNFVVKWLKEIGNMRNNIAHAYWFTTTDEGYVRIKTITDKDNWSVKLRNKLITPRIIKAHISRMQKVMDKLSGIWEMSS